MTTFTLWQIVGGLFLLVLGAELLVRGAARFAASFGLSPLVIGLTVVAYGTSAPEWSVSVQAALSGQADVSLGNVVGSNIFNVWLILGVSALVTPLAVALNLLRYDLWILLGATLGAWLLILDGRLSRVEGLLLVLGGIAYTMFTVQAGRKEGASSPQVANRNESRFVHAGLIVVGLSLLVLGANWLVTGSVILASALGVSPLIIGVTIVAAGTSLPELATSVVASLRGERDIAVGNVVGSNIFNLLGVLGCAALISPDGVTVDRSALAFDVPAMAAAAIACLPVFFTSTRIERWEGALFLAFYALYLACLIVDARGAMALRTSNASWLLFVLPSAVLVLWVGTAHILRRRSA